VIFLDRKSLLLCVWKMHFSNNFWTDRVIQIIPSYLISCFYHKSNNLHYTEKNSFWRKFRVVVYRFSTIIYVFKVIGARNNVRRKNVNSTIRSKVIAKNLYTSANDTIVPYLHIRPYKLAFQLRSQLRDILLATKLSKILYP
jgi:hypothetical protein